MIRSHRALYVSLLVGIALSTSVNAASDVAGMVKTSSGSVVIERAGKRLPALVGTEVRVADKLRTGENGAVGVTLADNTLLSAGPSSTLVIDKFVYDSTNQTGGMSINVRKGTLAVATGKIAKKTPESIDFHTPTSVLGVRGTEFVVEVGEGSDD